MKNKIKIFVAGHRGMVGSALIRKLKIQGYENIITKNRSDLDLSSQIDVMKFFDKYKPDQVYLAAAKVGGIQANNIFPADFIYQNLMIQNNIINSAFESGTKKILFLGSSCIYPKFCENPINENQLLNGHLEPTNEPYAIAKIAGIKMCESYNRQYGEKYGIDYRSVMPTNLYGPGDNYHKQNSHVIPALIRRFHDAKVSASEHVDIWGSGKPKREFLHVDDLAKACIFFMNTHKKVLDNLVNPMNSHVNIGYGSDISIKELANLIKEIVGYSGKIQYDSTKPDGTPKKLLDSSRINDLGWRAEINLKDGLKETYNDFKNFKNNRL